MEVSLRVIHIDLVNQYYQVMYVLLLTEFDYKYMKSQFNEK